MIQQREMHSAEKQLFTSVVSFSTTASYYSQLLTNAHPNYLIMLASINQEPIPLFHILDKGRDCLNHLYCCLITPLPHLWPHLSILMIFYSLWSTSLLHFLPFPDSWTFSSPFSTTMQHVPTLIHDRARHSAQLLTYIISHAPHNRHTSYMWLFSWVHTGGNGLGGWLAQATEGGVCIPWLATPLPPQSRSRAPSSVHISAWTSPPQFILPWEVKTLKSKRISLDLILFSYIMFFFLPFPFLYLWSFILDLSFSTHPFS